MFSMWNKAHIENLTIQSNIFTGQNAEQFLIRVLQEEEKDLALHLIKQELLNNDSIVTALSESRDKLLYHIEFDPVSEQSLEIWINEYLNQDISFGCFTRNDNILVSVDCLYVRNDRDEFPTSTELYKMWGAPFSRLIKYVRLIEIAIRNRRKCNYLTSFGVFTSANYRDIGIPSEMIRMRTVIAKLLRIEVFGSAFIGAEMQRAAKKYRYNIRRTFEEPEDMAKYDLVIDLPVNIFPIKIMAIEKRYARLD